jgi:hypothetical protein
MGRSFRLRAKSVPAAAVLLVALSGCERTAGDPDPAATDVASDGIVELESAMSDATVTDLAAADPAARTPGDEGPAAVDPLATDYPEAPVAEGTEAATGNVQAEKGVSE